jgi:LytS/YehU family sensor histidine kinase
LDRHFSWLQYGNLRFFAQLILGIVYTLLIINTTYLSIKYALTVDPPTIEQIIVTNVYGAVIFIPVYSIYFSLQFLRHWRKSALESERHQKESIRSQLESLKNHLDPHFLFNNLNILSSLIEKDRGLSQKFLENFGDVYRIMLKTKSDDLISLGDELKFVQSYIFLIKMRFGDFIIFEIEVDDEVIKLRLPPLTVQLLIENAIKHNFINEKRPLRISITANDGYLIVSNSLFEKKDLGRDSNGTGLESIRVRYRYFTDKEVAVSKSESYFSVKVPLLEIVSL